MTYVERLEEVKRLKQFVGLVHWIIAKGYDDPESMIRRIKFELALVMDNEDSISPIFDAPKDPDNFTRKQCKDTVKAIKQVDGHREFEDGQCQHHYITDPESYYFDHCLHCGESQPTDPEQK